jgi:DNA-binding PadR family transcriptional regulator
MRHTAMVPKGFIRYQVLESLNEKPMSGSEIMNEIEKRTNGRWKPSPGSIYPLLAWLEDNGHVKEVPTEQSGMKRYELTDTGRALLEEQKKIMDRQRKIMEEQRRDHKKFRKEARLFGPPFMGPPFMGPTWLHLSTEKGREIRNSMKRLVKTFFELGANLESNFSERTLEEITKVLNETTEKLENINKELKD